MIVYVHAAGMRDAGIAFQRHARVPVAELQHIVLPRSAGQDWVERVIERLPGHGSLFLLVLNCHRVDPPEPGNPGLQRGGGSLADTSLLTVDGLDSLGRLTPWFAARNQGVELHAGPIARGLAGRAFCQRFANACGAKVYAGLGWQIGSAPGADSDAGCAGSPAFGDGPDSWGCYEGPALCFAPGGIAPTDASADLMARGAWRPGTPALHRPYEVDEWALEHELVPPDIE